MVSEQRVQSSSWNGGESGVEWSGDEEQFTVDVLLPCRQFMTYC